MSISYSVTPVYDPYLFHLLSVHLLSWPIHLFSPLG